MLPLILFLMFFTMVLVSYSVFPAVYDRAEMFQSWREQRLSNNMEQLVSRSEARKMSRYFVLAPFVLGGVLGFFAPEDMRIFGAVFGAVIGFLLPGMWTRMQTAKTRAKFNDQLIDALMIMSSSFRGGLSLVQAMEAVCDEMPDPIHKEFATVLGENKMGVSLEDAFTHLYNRMPSAALQQMISAVLLARETGGNLPVIFNRIVTNIRENKKIQQNIDTLTIQGKIQGVVMSLLPLAFAAIIYSSNKRIFEHMLHSQVGRGLLIYAAVSWAVGAFLIWKISTFKEY